MIGEIDWFGRIVGGVADGDVSMNARVAKALIRAGLAVVIIEPNGKKAMCTLNERDKKKANIAAQDAARAAGSPNWEKVRHECGIKHAITEEKELTKVRVKTLLSEGANIAVALGRGERRILIVDVDTAEERRAFLSDWDSAESHADLWTDADDFPMTVTSPGVITTNVNGEDVWTHKNGGHFWFDIPDGTELPERPGKLTWCRCHGASQPKGGCRNAWAAYYGSGYVLVPPSVRPEGPYRLTGTVHRLPEWLSERIRESRTAGASEDGTAVLSRYEDDPIDAWSAETSWHDLLTEDGFSPAAHDSCGCPTFTRPGDATHSKSVTAHEPGCTQFDTSHGHGPLRIWSDALGSGTMSKLNYVTKYRHNGDTGKAMRSLGIGAISTISTQDGFTDDDLRLDLDDEPETDSPKAEAPESGADKSEETENDPFAPIDWEALLSNGVPPADFLPGKFMEKGQQVALVGDGKSGKSLFIFEWCVKAANGLQFMNEVVCDPLRILYLDKENSKLDIARRTLSFGANPSDLTGKVTYLSFPPFKPLDSVDGAKQVLALVKKYRPHVVILDTVSRFVEGKENESETWLTLYRMIHQRLKGAGISCIRLDHFGKDSDKGSRGSSAKSQDIDHVLELSVTEETQTVQGNGILIETVLNLKRTHTRTGLGPDFFRILRRGIKTLDDDNWFAGETRHEVSDAFDGGRSALTLPEELTPVRERPEDAMRAISEYLDGKDSGTPLRAFRGEIAKSLATRATIIDEAIQIMREEGYVNVERRGRANLHFLIRPYSENSTEA
jgi:hypothetical protein